jgi:hypothetical protein
MGTQKEVDWDAPAITDVKMVHKGPWGPEGTLIPISIKDFEKKSSIRRKVAAASGLPYEHVKLILVGIAQIGAGDRRTNIKYGNCGVAEGIGLTFSTAAAGNKPHQPRATGNRVDNKGNWTQEDRVSTRHPTGPKAHGHTNKRRVLKASNQKTSSFVSFINLRHTIAPHRTRLRRTRRGL